MSTFVKAFSDIVALFLQAFRFAALLPAFIFVGLNASVVIPLLKETRIYDMIQPLATPISTGFLILIVVLLVAYILAVMNNSIIRFFEGFPLLQMGNRFRMVHLKRIAHLQRAIASFEKQASYHVSKSNEHKDKNEVEQAQQAEWLAEQYAMQSNLSRDELIWMYPHHETWRTLPTRLGNIIASAEEFPSHLYGMDSVTLWPYLNPILSEEGYATFIEREKSIMDFLLNCAIVAFTFFLEIAYVDFLLGQFNVLSFLKIVTGIILCFCFYLLAIPGALSWGYTIRVAFVLYKEKLRERLNLVHPEGYYQDRNLWKDVSRFFRDHDVTPGRRIFDYSAKAEKREDMSQKAPK